MDGSYLPYPYETDFTLIGTTDVDHSDLSQQPFCSEEEKDYLLAFASSYFRTGSNALILLLAFLVFDLFITTVQSTQVPRRGTIFYG